MGTFFARRSVRREDTARDLAIVGLIGVCLAGVTLALLGMQASGTFSSAPQVTAEVTNVGASLTTGSDVKMQGVIVGRVTKIETVPGSAKVVLRIHKSEIGSIPSNAVARVLPATVFGTSYVDLTVHGKRSRSALRPGAVVPQDMTQETVEFQQALDDIDNLVKALGPAQLASALTSLARAVDGRGSQLGETIDIADRLVGRALAETPTLRTDIRLFADNMEILRRNAPDLLNAVSDGLVFANTIIERQGELTALLTGGFALADHATVFLHQRGPALERAIRQAAVVIDAAYDNRRSGILSSFAANGILATKLPTTSRDGQLQISGGLLTSGPAYYTSADCPTYGTLRGNC